MMLRIIPGADRKGGGGRNASEGLNGCPAQTGQRRSNFRNDHQEENPTSRLRDQRGTSEFVYPAHGVSQIVSTEEQEVACAKRELFVISFIKDKMTLPVPTARIMSVGMRKLAEPPSASSTRPRSRLLRVQRSRD
jgi:hypothetical protein